MLRILLTGSNGLLGQKIVYAAIKHSDIQLLATSKGENRLHTKAGYDYVSMDITNADEVTAIVENFKPHCIINTAAMTNVDACEKDQENCWKMNVEAVRTMTELCQLHDIHFIHLSTDFVFDGEKGNYSEEDAPNPLSHYARSKFESEKVVQQAEIDSAILRTIIIYGVVDDKQRSNVVIWTINSLRQQKNINVISDQMRSPTLAEDLADACLQAALKRATGIYHVSGSETMSILEMVNRTADFFQLDKKYIHPITTAQLNQPAKRPLLTGFNIDKAKRELNFQPHTLQQGLEIVKSQLEN
ncbi:MAG TPA: dTDP-4-dehydrorhamnose reductase [Bacteroidia bacterium]|nr:dTDP-4-dehydrorhamnose reductase [Bacteroidia bacterium]MBP7714016.1 dTDP-4-dehydrorhamnose reductase [Bacteroidia bacterium]MBP8667711.1 dTDP-4-dehydrorhamnose reductase [Bacteroidia bacterium]HOZ82397.1 dTDP-4-dehydrorhamnose reductase [Bacteroidia bacterium]HOZ91375.1 dTDP-4-dehydrorhamnose reductase [Bacteroidia bacterium]